MDVGTVLLRLAILFVAARMAAEIAERLRFPAVLAEICVGILLGPSLFGLVDGSEPLGFLGELGAIFLLLEVGLHMDLGDLRRVGRSAMQVAWIGVIVPMAAGFVAMRGLGMDGPTALFLAAGITATSVGITARVFADMRTLASVEAQTVLGAAVADDVIGLMILTVVTRMSLGGGFHVNSILEVTAAGVGFLVVATALGVWLIPLVFERVIGRSRIEGTLIGAAIAFTLAIAGLANAAKLAPIVGAFVAGVALGRAPQRDDIRRALAPVGHLFIPVFFLLIGAETHVQALARPGVLATAGVLGAIAVVAKVVAGAGVPKGQGDRFLVGVGMIPRGEVGLVFATLGLSSGVLGASEHATLLVVVLATTLVAPPWLRRLIERNRRKTSSRTEDEAPADGWLIISDDEVELRAEPPAGLVARIGLEAATLCADRRPGPRLRDWLSKAPPQPAVWGPELLDRFLTLLRTGNLRSWRLLDVTGLMPLLLPQLEKTANRAPTDPFDLDPSSAFRWHELEALKDLVADPDDDASSLWSGVDRDAVLLAAFAVSAFGPYATREVAELTRTLGLHDDRGELVRFLVTERHLLPAAAARLGMGREEAVLELAAHIGDRRRCDALYLLSAAIEPDPTARERLDELRALVAAALAQPEFADEAGVDVVEARKQEVARLRPAGTNVAVKRLLATAPRRYLLAHRPEQIARHIQMLDPPPTRYEVRMFPEPHPEQGEWTLYVATPDRPGALGAIAGALASNGIPIIDASVTTWPNGMIADIFRVKAGSDIDWEAVRRAASTTLVHTVANGKPVGDRRTTGDRQRRVALVHDRRGPREGPHRIVAARGRGDQSRGTPHPSRDRRHGRRRRRRHVPRHRSGRPQARSPPAGRSAALFRGPTPGTMDAVASVAPPRAQGRGRRTRKAVLAVAHATP